MKSLLSRIALTLLSLSFLAPSLVFAQGGLKAGQQKLKDVATQAYGSTPQSDLESIVGMIIRGFLGLLGIAFVILMVYAGFLWMTAQGEQEQVTKSKRLITQAVIGLAIVLAAYAIAEFVITRVQEATT